MTEATGATLARIEIVNDSKVNLHDRHNYHLSESRPRFEDEAFRPAIPAGNEQLPLVIGINQTHQVAKYDSIFVAKTGAWQDHSRQTRVLYIYGYTCGY
jgi:hypothetical protein